MNVCGACGADFRSVVIFDAHRVGKHELDYPVHEDGRRCLVGWEMKNKGWRIDAQGLWFDPERVEKARKAFTHV
jgi:hypothetical protein